MVDAPTDDVEVPEILTRAGGATIAYRRRAGRTPGVVFLPGFMSDMSGDKAIALDTLCAERGHACLRFDYRGHGQSGGNFADGTVGLWASDAVAALDDLTEGPQILVGSSMGGWIMLLAALARPERVAALVGIAAAPDFTEDLLAAEMTDADRAAIAADGHVMVPSDYGDDYMITGALLDDGRDHLVLRGRIPLDLPVRLLHGLRDDSVPWETALRIAERLRGDDVEVILVKNGDHRLSTPPDLERLRAIVGRLFDQSAPISAASAASPSRKVG
jgi:pimeloyl-ACP methyl ester carboxylesterase